MLLQADSSFLGAYLAAAESGDVIIGYELYQELCNLREDIISEKYIYSLSCRFFIDRLRPAR